MRAGLPGTCARRNVSGAVAAAPAVAGARSGRCRCCCSGGCPVPWRVARRSATSIGDADAIAQSVFGYRLRPFQREAVAASLRGDSMLVVLPTAAGKSACFQIPALMQKDCTVRPATTLVVSPLLALMREQVLRLRNLGIDADEVDTSASSQAPVAYKHSSRRRSRQSNTAAAAAAAVAPRLLYTTPEWIVRHHDRLKSAGVRVVRLVVDEAHCISDWGASTGFRSAYLQLGAVRNGRHALVGGCTRPRVLSRGF
jgi:ATP-dependent DNA helicase RecQ